ncbi:hypothetical protein BT96DRAFT_59620 [Gymnopus androsaceus JB14]|uniref:Uncharacterized protein n=1 Tax=Gymnopus androsaceus JB14 TaxID=1447944 RepID=A0A6A4IDG2_9AGAR|nr:hypothetical protein BT96DRAFT_59620 [Gymnopus androsaceus JB14]
MASSYDTRPTSIPSGSTLPRRPSFNYERVRPATPPERRGSPSYDSYASRYSSYSTSDPYREYQRYPSPGVYDRYRDVPVDISWNKSASYPSKRGYDYSGPSPRGRDRRESSGSATAREFEPSDSWKHSNGSQDRERKSSREYYSSDRYSPRDRDRDDYIGKSSQPSSTPSYSQERPYSRDYRTPERASDSYRSARNSYDPDEYRRNLRSPSRSPKRRYRSGSRSRSRSYSPSPRFPSRSRSRTPSKHSRLPAHSFEPEASVADFPARPYHYQDSSAANQPLSLIPTEPRPTVASALPSSSDKDKPASPSPSQSSIASSRETSVKPPASRTSDPDVGKTLSTTWFLPRVCI